MSLESGKCTPEDCAACTGCESGASINEERRTIELTLEDGSTVECAILTFFPAGDFEYIALLPLDENGQNADGEVYIYRFGETENGDPILANIESDEEYDLAAQAFDQIMEQARKDEEAGAPIDLEL